MITNVIYAVLVLGVIAVVFGLILSVAAKAFEVKVDERLPKIQACLAGANCGGCGYPGCAGCAEAILAGKAPVTACAPAGAEGAAKIAEIMGMEAPSGEKQVAHVLCNGGEASVKNFEYVGLHDCVAATKVAGGPTACSFGCMGFGTCVAACQFDAIHINAQGVAEVDKEKCTNCGACREACPRKLIVEVPYKQKVFVNCSNKEKGPAVTKVCANSCIACGMCERTCKFDAIHVVNNVAVIDYTKCKNCTMCAKACPRNAIEPIPTPEEKEKFKAAQKAAAAGKHDSAIRDIRSQLRRSSLQHAVDGFHDLQGRLPEGFLRFLGGNLHCFGKAGYQVTSPDIHKIRFGTLIGRTNLYLDILCGSFANQKVMFFTHIAYQ